mmetsp:Transcript_90749/g.143433  ORF Transcript_90749/g.143433 Transcript_90749/m.143433 type:complete len:148 (-) Transcript_90749:89-532(-)|eukprot:CAMPEP_0169098474 /NCGR_PEP_ID=MMETSP1015-20121227/20060_1 /TAXON_ID=342587 /ORGANISM="Karlodinium micrum, Strain CCMP2283" /LENGTH=147 /DNA_ID=CAMNT_0009159325 /DNA_START=54 /DNA_END=497 /DNA_ORIENTATION=-
MVSNLFKCVALAQLWLATGTLNFRQIVNNLEGGYTIYKKNLNNEADNHEQKPKPAKTVRREAWLGSRHKPVELWTDKGKIVEIWDEDWHLMVEDRNHKITEIDVDNNKDFHVEVYDDRIVLNCEGCEFADHVGDTVEVKLTKSHSEL